MSQKIIAIEETGPDRKARRLLFDDGSEPRVTSATAVKHLGLSTGTEVPAAALDAALAEVEPALAKERAFQLIGYREHTTGELRAKLEDDGYGTSSTTSAVERCLELGLVDDLRFAEMSVRAHVAAGRGARRIARELAQRGVSAEIIAQALGEESSADRQIARAREALGDQQVTDRRDRERLIRRLATRGFDLDIAVRAVDSLGEALDTDFDP